MLLTAGLRGTPAYALPATDPPQKEKAIECLGDLQGTLSTTPQSVNLWQTATLRWNVTVPSSCTGVGLKLYVDNQAVSPIGSRSIQPIANTGYRLHAALPAVLGGGRRTLITTAIKVIMPQQVTITANYMVPLLLQALRDPFIPGTSSRYIYIENHVELDLSGRESIPIAGGVTLAGGRTPRQAGPRLFTTIRPKALFAINGDNVRITGVRIEGPDHSRVVPEDEEPNKGIGILVDRFINIKIDHNEIYGWSQAAVRVLDCDGNGCPSGGRMLPSENPTAVRIHDNYIHHNQRAGREGYGVSVDAGAYVLIERNVFDWNRHAIKGAGESGTGYAAYRNLVLKNGGYHDTYNACDLDSNWLALVSPGTWLLVKALCILPTSNLAYVHYTHQFDMHGTETCGIGHLNCGDAGHSMYIRHNTFLYTAGNAIKLRGIPEVGMFIGTNVFAHDSFYDDAVVQTENFGAYAEPGNVVGNEVDVVASTEPGSCDFDGDGSKDSFMATGATWWYSSEGKKPWVYLNTSLKRRSQVTLGFFNADNICDVWVDGVIYPGGKTQTLPVNSLPGGGVLQ